jgi:hypothetical protein
VQDPFPLFQTPSASAPPAMKIIIVGAGISGLSTYLFLKKYLRSLPGRQDEIKIYEAYDVSKYIPKTPDAATPDSAAERNEVERAGNALLDEPAFTPEAIGAAIGIGEFPTPAVPTAIC